MGVTVYDFKGKHQANSIAELATLLEKRYGSEVNGFWISHEGERHPVMCLLAKSDLSTLLYVPSDGHPGFVPKGSVEGLEDQNFTTFSIDSVEQELEVLNSQVIPLCAALSAVMDFFELGELPKSIKWDEL